MSKRGKLILKEGIEELKKHHFEAAQGYFRTARLFIPDEKEYIDELLEYCEEGIAKKEAYRVENTINEIVETDTGETKNQRKNDGQDYKGSAYNERKERGGQDYEEMHRKRHFNSESGNSTQRLDEKAWGIGHSGAHCSQNEQKNSSYSITQMYEANYNEFHDFATSRSGTSIDNAVRREQEVVFEQNPSKYTKISTDDKNTTKEYMRKASLSTQRNVQHDMSRGIFVDHEIKEETQSGNKEYAKNQISEDTFQNPETTTTCGATETFTVETKAHEERSVKDVVINIECEKEAAAHKYQKDKATEMLAMSLTLRAYVMQFGIEAFALKSNYRPDVDFKDVKSKINYLIRNARRSFYLKNRIAADRLLCQAEQHYEAVALILPQASISKPIQPKTETHTNNESNESRKPNDNNIQAGNSGVNSETYKTTSYKEFVKGDNIDVIKCLKLAEAALFNKDFKKAERLIKKSERICPTKNAKELFKRVEAAKQEEERAAQEAVDREKAQLAQERAAKEAARLAEERVAKEAKKGAAKESAKQVAKEDKERSAKEAARVAEQQARKAEDRAAKEAAKQDSKQDNQASELAATEPKIRAVKEVAGQAVEADNQTREAVRRAKDQNDDFITQRSTARKFQETVRRSDKQIVYDAIFCDTDPTAETSAGTANSEIVVEEAEAASEDEKKKVFVDDRAVRDCLNIAKEAMNNNDFTKAEKFLMKAKRIDTDLDIKELHSQIKIGIASRSSSVPEPPFEIKNDEPVFQPTNDKKKNSKDCAKIAETFLKKGDVKKAEIFLLKAKEFYDGKMLKPLFDELNSIKEKKVISKPSYVDSPSETHFAYSPGRETVPSYHLPNPSTCQEAEKNLEKGRMALTARDYKSAESYARKAAQVYNVRGQGLIQDIEDTKKKDRIYYNLTQTRVTSTMPSTKGNETEKKHEIQKLLSSAELEFFEGNLDHAEELLNSAISLGQSPQAEHLLDKIKSARLKNETEAIAVHSKGHNNQPSISREVDNSDDVKICIKKAQEAFEEKDLDKCERLLIKANRMRPTKVIQTFLDKVQREKEKQSKEDIKNAEQSRKTPENEENIKENKREAKKCIDLAEKAYIEGDYDKAERFFKKASRMDPSDYVQSLIIKVKIAMENKLKEQVSEDEDFEIVSKNANVDTTADKKKNEYLNLALNAKEKGNYYAAEGWLLKALRLFPKDDVVTSVLTEVRKILKDGIAKRSKDGIRDTEIEDQKCNEMINEAQKYLQMAEEKISQGDHDNAKSLVIIADSLYPMDRSGELLELIWNLKIDTEKSRKSKAISRNVQNWNTFKAEEYKAMAKRAIELDHLTAAKHYLIKSIAFKPSVKANKMLIEVREKILNPDKGNEGVIKAAWNSFCNIFKNKNAC